MRETGAVDDVASHLRAGLRVSCASVLWSCASGATAVVLGLASNSLVLAAFGSIGLIDAAGSVSLVVHFRHALGHEAISDRYERVSLRIVTIGMGLVGFATAGVSIQRIVEHESARAVPIGVALAGMSMGILVVLASNKRRIARLIPSHALYADAWLSMTGAAIAFVTVAGTALGVGFGWWWIDPAVASGVATVAIAMSVVLRRGGDR